MLLYSYITCDMIISGSTDKTFCGITKLSQLLHIFSLFYNVYVRPGAEVLGICISQNLITSVIFQTISLICVDNCVMLFISVIFNLSKHFCVIHKFQYPACYIIVQPHFSSLKPPHLLQHVVFCQSAIFYLVVS